MLTTLKFFTINNINSKLDKIITEIGTLKGEINKQRKKLENAISKYKKEINHFLTYAGYNYQIDIDGNDNNIKFILQYKGERNTKVENIDHTLSFGERNAFALILFMFEAKNKGADLIILDDPISSFDNNKKYAILHMLFSKYKFRDKGGNKEGTNLLGETILMLTHDFDPIIDIIKVGKPKSLGINKTAYFLTNKDGELNEKEIKEEDIKTFLEIYEENLSELNDINKLIYLRRFYEIENNKGLEYNLLSELFHKREKIKNMKEEDIEKAEKNISQKVAGFNYYDFLEKVKDNDYMKKLYKESKSNYEKLQIYRIIKDNGKGADVENDIIKKFIDEAFHIENERIFQLNPIKYDTVPYFIIKKCNEDLSI